MKKIITGLTLILLVLITSACGNKSGQLTCTMKNNIQEGIVLESKYIIDYQNDYVTKLKTTETIKADNKEDLTTYKEALEQAYEEYNNIEYYQNNISIENNTLISSTIINYEKVDTEKLIEIDSNNKQLIKNKKILLKDIKEMYKENGCNCK